MQFTAFPAWGGGFSFLYEYGIIEVSVSVGDRWGNPEESPSTTQPMADKKVAGNTRLAQAKRCEQRRSEAKAKEKRTQHHRAIEDRA